ncbi:TPA: hypothetical protein JA361_06990 [Legionella pneumophila]|nr:hypothetical protein [Legionella pneumophila]HAT8181638.1 hypothetical protein [Legionella pneumophila]
MQQKIELVVGEQTSKFVINYHKHPEVGGVGHVSMEITHKGQSVILSVYPSEEISLATPIVIVSMYVFPSKAVNHTTPQKTDSPIYASYNITEQVENMDAAFEKAKELIEIIESGRAAFTLTPSRLTHIATVVMNSNSSNSNLLWGLRFMDRELIDNEFDSVDVINCAEAISRVIKAGGIERPEGMLPFQTPSSINSYFASMSKSSENSEADPEQSQKKSAVEAPGFFRSMFNSVCGFFTPKGTQSSKDLRNETTSFEQDSFALYSSSGSSRNEPEKVEQEVEKPSPGKETQSREADTSSPRASECSESFFAQSFNDTSSVIAKKDDESDLDYCSRIDAMIH